MRTDRENKQTGWSFESDWFSKWHEFSWPITELSELKPKQSQITFDTQLIIVWKCWLCYKGSLLVTSQPQRLKKIDFCFIWLNWIQTFKLTFPFKNFLKSLKATELFRKTYFQIKVNKSGRCHNLEPGRIPWGKFSRQPLMLRLDDISIFCLHRF